MKDIALIAFKRKNKNIVIYVRPEFFNQIAEMVLDEIVDVEVYEEQDSVKD